MIINIDLTGGSPTVQLVEPEDCEQAKSKGWLDERGEAIQAHIEWVS